MFKDKVWKKVLKINEYEVDEQIAELTFELADQLDMDEEEINERFNILWIGYTKIDRKNVYMVK